MVPHLVKFHRAFGSASASAAIAQCPDLALSPAASDRWSPPAACTAEVSTAISIAVTMLGLAREKHRAPTKGLGGVLWEAGTDRRGSFGMTRGPQGSRLLPVL